MILFETPRLYARRLCQQDEALILRLSQDPAAKKGGLSAEFWAQDARGVALALIRKEDDAWIGAAHLGDMNRYEGYLEMEYGLLPAFRGMGYGREAVCGLTDFAFDARQTMVLAAWVRSGNGACARLLEACGYTLEGRLRCHARDGQDTLCYSMLRKEWEEKANTNL